MPRMKLRPEQIPEIKRLRSEGRTVRELGEQFGVTPTTISRVCLGNSWGPNVRNDELRFRKYIQIGDPDGCHIWTGAKNHHGYGVFRFSKDGTEWNELAHRVAFKLAGNVIPDKLMVRHKCDVPACVNPDHLEVGTHSQNMADMLIRKRNRFGTVHGERGTTSLNLETAREIRTRSAAGETRRALATEFKVSEVTIHKILHNLRWKEP